MDSEFIKAQFEAAMKLVGWAVRACSTLADAQLAAAMHGIMMKQCVYLERKFNFTCRKN